MEFIELLQVSGIDTNKKLNKTYTQFYLLLSELKTKQLSEEIVHSINQGIEQINAVSDSEKDWQKLVRKTQLSILKLIEKELKLVPKHHYRNTWMSIGIVVFGFPIGILFGKSQGNMNLFGVGLPIGMAVGIAIGTWMDKKAIEEGRQLNLLIN